ncbi:MAG: helix-turn-helix domain-containing protein [Candidatus Eisenbacteria bacterium]|nr:helix-turn-helix domain-containing protein [Candidatus Eisenbacteria bacterium]
MAHHELKMTPSRRVILEELRASKEHPTADELYERVRRDLPRISLGTVYRNLDVLSKHGLIRVIGEAGEQRRYDGDLDGHYHVRCVRCGRVGDVVLDALRPLEDAVEDADGFAIDGFHLCFTGLCPRCAGENQNGGLIDGSDRHEN